MQNVLQAQYAQYRSAQDSIDLINKKYHDFKHQIAVLRSETSEEKGPLSRRDGAGDPQL